MNNRKILVTGGGGFIGSALAYRLLKDNFSVRVIDSGLRGNPARLKDIIKNIEFIDADVRDRKAMYAACKGIDTVFHLAYLNGTEFFYKRPDLVLDIGVKGMVNVVDASISAGVKEFFLMSSSEVYQTASVIPTPENIGLSVPDPLNPRYSYGGGKIISEIMAINYGKLYFDRTVIIRPHNVYGPDMGWEHVIPQFVDRMKKLRADNSDPSDVIDFPIQGSGAQTRAFIYIDDFIEGVMRLLSDGMDQSIYNIGTMDEISVFQVALMVGRILGRTIKIVPTDILLGSTERRCPDVSKITRLGFKPRVSFNEGLEKTVKWYDANMCMKPEKSLSGELWIKEI